MDMKGKIVILIYYISFPTPRELKNLFIRDQLKSHLWMRFHFCCNQFFLILFPLLFKLSKNKWEKEWNVNSHTKHDVSVLGIKSWTTMQTFYAWAMARWFGTIIQRLVYHFLNFGKISTK